MFSKLIIFTLLINQIFAFSLLPTKNKPLEPLVPSEEYTHKYIADDDNPNQFILFTKFGNDEDIIFEMHSKCTGWVGLGIAVNGGMEGADIAIGWVDGNGKANLKDTFTSDFSQPTIDKSQDLQLISGAEMNGYTIIKFKRKLNTCDKSEDNEIRSETNYLLFAWNNEDPNLESANWIKKHKPTDRFVRVTMLFDYISDNIIVDHEAISDYSREFYINNLEIPAKRTFYYCQMFEMELFENDVHFIGYDLQLKKESKGLVHHLIVFECDPDFNLNSVEKTGYECGPVAMPNIISAKCRSKALTSWGIGGPINMTFPNTTGYFYPKNTKRVILFEMHYDNLPNADGNTNVRRDNSGMKLYFTKKLRPLELGVFVNGLGIGGFPLHDLNIQIPSNTKQIKVSSICFPGCTSKYFPEEGITAISGFLHTHLAGKKIKTQLIRNGKVISELFNNPKYDPDYQYNVDINPTKMYKGDALYVECVYDTAYRDTFTFWGYGTLEEMCTNMIYYYPRIDNFDYCYSTTEVNTLFSFYESLMRDNLLPSKEISQENEDEIKALLENANSTEALRSKFKHFYEQKNKQTAYCGSNKGQTKYDQEYIDKEEMQIEVKDNCQLKSSANTLRTLFTYSILSMITSLEYFF